MMRRIQLFLEDELIEFAEEQAKKESLLINNRPSRSALIRKAVIEYKEKVEKE